MANPKDQIGCGYCDKEKTCKIRDPKINKAKLGCADFQHWTKTLKIKQNGK